jgi:hypothetical protein
MQGAQQILCTCVALAAATLKALFMSSWHRQTLLCVLTFAALAAGLNSASAVTLDIRVNASASDATQTGTTVNLTSAALDFSAADWVGQRFASVTIPQGAYIISAYVTFTAKTPDANPFSTTLYGEAADNSSVFATSSSNISNRSRTSAAVAWSATSNWQGGDVNNTSELKTVVQEIVNRSGWASGNSLSILVQKNIGSRRVQSYDGSTTQAPLLHVEYMVIARPVATRLLFVVSNSASLTAQETVRKTMFQAFGYTVSLVSANAAQATFDTFAAANDVAYISEEITATDLNTKLKSKSLGVVSEKPDLADDFAMASSYANPLGSATTVASNTHYITASFSIGSLVITTSSQSLNTYSGTLATDVNTLASISSAAALCAVEMNGKLNDGTKAAGRRVQMPWGGSTFDFNSLTPDGINLLSRALAWSGGVVAYWRLDESSGTLANDASVNLNHGTLTNLSFDTNAVWSARVNGGLSFNGTSAFVTAPNATVFDLRKALSNSAWIRGNSWGSGANVDVILRKGEASPNKWQLAIENGYVALALDGNDGANVHGNTLLQTGQWYHVVGTWDGANIRIYVNGVLDNTPTARAAPIGTDTRPVYLGGRSGAGLFDGTLDDVRLFNHELKADEIIALKGQGQTGGVRVIKWVEIQ